MAKLVTKSKTKELKTGDAAPDFSLENESGKTISLKNLAGKWTVLYFYPKDDTPGCTIEAITFTKQLSSFEKMDGVILGVSPDSCESHQKFIKKHKLKVGLLSDPTHAMLESYGVWQLKKFMGREYLGVVRTTFLIDPKGKIACVWPNVKVEGHVEEVKAKLGEFAG